MIFETIDKNRLSLIRCDYVIIIIEIFYASNLL